MKLTVVAVGTRLPGWANEAFDEYARRMPRTARIALVEVKPEPRSAGRTPAAMMRAEAARIDAAIPAGAGIIALDERGREFTTAQFADWLGKRIERSEDTAFVIGGPDGLAPELKERADLMLRLSPMTLPHALARVLLAEQLYRAASILHNHPYHRD